MTKKDFERRLVALFTEACQDGGPLDGFAMLYTFEGSEDVVTFSNQEEPKEIVAVFKRFIDRCERNGYDPLETKMFSGGKEVEGDERSKH